LRLLVGTLLLLAVQGTGRVEILVHDSTTREGVPGVPITLTFKVPNEPAGPANTLVTDPRGLTTFSALRAGAYTINIGEGFQAVSSSEYVLVEAGTQKRVEIPVKRVTTVAGKIVDQNGTPSVAAVITLLSMVYVDGRQVLRSAARTTINREGKFGMTGVPFGEYYMRIENESPWSVAYYPGVADLSSATKLTIRDQIPFSVEIKLPDHPRFKVSGSVIHSPSEAGALTVYIAHDNAILQEEPFFASASSVRVIVRRFAFPGWVVSDGSTRIETSPHGRDRLVSWIAPPGAHEFRLYRERPAPERVGLLISVSSAVLLLMLWLLGLLKTSLPLRVKAAQ